MVSGAYAGDAREGGVQVGRGLALRRAYSHASFPSLLTETDPFSLPQGNEKQCLCTLNANPDTLTRLETARVTYNSLSDAVRRPTAISSSDLASLHHDIQTELAEGKRTSEFWTKGGWEEPVNKAAAHGFDVLSQVIEKEEKEGKLQWIDQYDGVVKILRHLSGVLIYQSIASAPTFSKRRKVGEVDDFSAWVAVALAGRPLNAESAALIEDMVRSSTRRLAVL